MVHKAKDDLQKLFSDWPLDGRATVWLCLTLQGMGMRFNIDDFDTQSMWYQMSNWITSNDLTNEIENRKNQEIVPDHLLSWIEKTGRQPTWLLKEFIKDNNKNDMRRSDDVRRSEGIFRDEKSSRESTNALRKAIRGNFSRRIENSSSLFSTDRGQRYSRDLFPICPNHLPDREKLIAWIDYLPDSKSRKQRTLERLQAAWIQHQTEDQHFNWYTSGGKEKEKCGIAWDWYQKTHPSKARIFKKFIKQEDVLSFLDQTDFDLDAKRYHLEQIKKKFKYEQTKANRKGKTQTNLSLSDEAKTQLDEIAKRERITKTQLIEHLILRAYEDGLPK